MKSDKPITLSRDCEAIVIPSGERHRLPAGSQVWITQSLGDNYTVMTDRGYMVRLASKDADALGMEVTITSETGAGAATEGVGDIEKLVWDQLRTCFDPEIPVNIVELGLVYHCGVTPLAEGKNRVEIRFTLTAPGCGMGAILKEDIRNRILKLPGIKEVDVELVWDPPWNQSMISSAAKLQLGMV